MLLDRPTSHISVHPTLLHGLHDTDDTHCGALAVTSTDRSDKLLMHGDASDPARYSTNVRWHMALGVVNNNGVALDAVRLPPLVDVAATSADPNPHYCLDGAQKLREMPQISEIFKYTTSQLHHLRLNGLDGLNDPQLHPPAGTASVIYTKDASAADISTGQRMLFPREDSQLAVIKAAAAASAGSARPAGSRRGGIDSVASGAGSGPDDGRTADVAFAAHRNQLRHLFAFATAIRHRRAAHAKKDDKHRDNDESALLHMLYPHESVLHRRRLDNLSFVEFLGVTQSSYVYIKDGFAFFNVHIEQMLFPFVHTQREGSSYWIIIPYTELPELYKLAGEIYQLLYRPSGLSADQRLVMGRAMVLSKQLFLSPEILADAHIRFTEHVLIKGETLMAPGGCAHFGFSTDPGRTVSVAFNACTDRWLEDGLPYLVNHMQFLRQLKQLQQSKKKLKALGAAPTDKFNDVTYLIQKAINNCPPAYMCAFLRGLYADFQLILAQQPLSDSHSVCSYPALLMKHATAEATIRLHVEQIESVLTDIHEPSMRTFLKAYDEECQCSDCNKNAMHPSEFCLSILCKCDCHESVLTNSTDAHPTLVRAEDIQLGDLANFDATAPVRTYRCVEMHCPHEFSSVEASFEHRRECSYARAQTTMDEASVSRLQPPEPALASVVPTLTNDAGRADTACSAAAPMEIETWLQTQQAIAATTAAEIASPSDLPDAIIQTKEIQCSIVPARDATLTDAELFQLLQAAVQRQWPTQLDAETLFSTTDKQCIIKPVDGGLWWRISLSAQSNRCLYNAAALAYGVPPEQLHVSIIAAVEECFALPVNEIYQSRGYRAIANVVHDTVAGPGVAAYKQQPGCHGNRDSSTLIQDLLDKQRLAEVALSTLDVAVKKEAAAADSLAPAVTTEFIAQAKSTVLDFIRAHWAAEMYGSDSLVQLHASRKEVEHVAVIQRTDDQVPPVTWTFKPAKSDSQQYRRSHAVVFVHRESEHYWLLFRRSGSAGPQSVQFRFDPDEANRSAVELFPSHIKIVRATCWTPQLPSAVVTR